MKRLAVLILAVLLASCGGGSEPDGDGHVTRPDIPRRTAT